jgi:hypothetical protein
MAFIRIRTIKGRRYRYREHRWRENGKVMSKSESLGPEDGWSSPIIVESRLPKVKRMSLVETIVVHAFGIPEEFDPKTPMPDNFITRAFLDDCCKSEPIPAKQEQEKAPDGDGGAKPSS